MEFFIPIFLILVWYLLIKTSHQTKREKKSEREYKTKLLQAEQTARRAMVEAMGGNIDATYDLIDSNLQLISSNLNVAKTSSESAARFEAAMKEHQLKMALLNSQ